MLFYAHCIAAAQTPPLRFLSLLTSLSEPWWSISTSYLLKRNWQFERTFPKIFIEGYTTFSVSCNGYCICTIIAAKKQLRKDTNNKKRLAWAKKHEQWILDRWKSVFCETQSRWTDDLRMCISHREAWRWCDGALLVALSVTNLEFKALCSNTPSHLVCA